MNVRDFEDLEVYREAREFRKRVYKLTRLLPGDEKFIIIPQMRRAAISITNNIAESHGRYGYQDKARFLRNARGSMQEILDDINICEDEKYAKKEHLDDLRQHGIKVRKLINGYIAYLNREKKKGQ